MNNRRTTVLCTIPLRLFFLCIGQPVREPFEHFQPFCLKRESGIRTTGRWYQAAGRMCTAVLSDPVCSTVCSYMFHLSGDNSRDRYFKGS